MNYFSRFKIWYKEKSKKFRRRFLAFSFAFILFLIYWISIPSVIFNSPVSTVVLSSDGHLLGARVASDGQWRFPASDSIPERFKKCIIAFEDQYFYYHPGINPISIFRAFTQNIKAGKVVSGGSTITMQVARLSMNHPNRSVLNKFTEVFRATQLEFSYSKDEILNFWACNAPFGGNVVGLEAASWRYFNRTSFQLSWAETATLAVLPNAPSLMYIGKNQHKLIEKRNRLLLRLLEEKEIDTITYNLSIVEDLPNSLFSIPNDAPHITDELFKLKPKSAIKTTIDHQMQIDLYRLIQPFVNKYSELGIGNAAVLVLDIKTGKVLAYQGNMTSEDKKLSSGFYVDIIKSERSSGSTLKPLLYAALYNRGEILPSTLVPDIPTYFGSYQPQNFNKEFSGLVPASTALATSLNVPAVRMLQKFGVLNFYNLLRNSGFINIDKGADHYGLSLILGGAEVSLWELTGAYASMARVINNYQSNGYNIADWHEPYFMGEIPSASHSSDNQILSASSLALTMNSLLDANRPANESGWRLFENTEKIAWKTGTSYGFRDAWAVGVNSRFAVGVWVGNADGEGRPGLTGLSFAAPLMFRVFGYLPDTTWFNMPTAEMIKVDICNQSGYKAGPNCDETHSQWEDKNASQSALCPYHKLVHLDQTESWQVNSSCAQTSQMISKKWFIMPPVYEYYYKLKNPDYKSPPPFHPDCLQAQEAVIEFIYPEYGSKIYIPMDFSGKPSSIVFKATHRDKDADLHWHLDSKFIGTTNNIHEMVLLPSPGKHYITLMDNVGNTKSVSFEILNKE